MKKYVLAVVAAACGHAPSTVAPPTSGTWLGYCGDLSASDELDRTVLAFMKDQHVPGLELAIRHRGKPVAERAYGYASLETCALVTPTTQFGIGSLSKQFLAAEIQTLAREGKLSLDDSPAKVLPESGTAWAHVQLRHMLRHSSGIRDYCGDDEFHDTIATDRMQEPAPADEVRRLAAQPLGFEPGAGWGYSNTAYLLLSIIAERVVGKPLPELMRERVFQRIGMAHTGFADPHVIVAEMATGYSFDPATKQIVHGKYRSTFYSTKGDTGMRSTAGDLIRWHRALLAGQVLDASELAEATTPTRLDGWQSPNGFGWFFDTIDGRLVMMHAGTFSSGYSGFIVRVPGEDTAIAIVSNQVGASLASLAHTLLARLEPALDVAPDAPPRADPDPARTARMLAAFHARDASANTPGWNHFLANARKLAITEMLASVDHVELVGCTTTRAPYDPDLDRVAHCIYRGRVAGEPSHLTVCFDPTGRIACVWPE